MTTKIWGYWRCSTEIQDQERQIRSLKDAGCEVIVGDKITGKSDYGDREALPKLLDEIKEGDLLILDELNRLGRTMITMLIEVNKLMEKGYYDEARALYVQVLEDDPGDEEAIVKKKIAERKIINRDLIKIRDQIGSGSFKDALYTSKIVLRNINNWKIETDPNAARFLNVRRKKLFPYFRKHILFQLKNSTFTPVN